jgi:Transposase DDE domain
LAPANGHDAPFAIPLLRTAVALYHLRPRVVRLDAAYWGGALIAWIHTTLGAVAVIPFNPKRTKDRSRLAPTWTAASSSAASSRCSSRVIGTWRTSELASSRTRRISSARRS